MFIRKLEVVDCCLSGFVVGEAHDKAKQLQQTNKEEKINKGNLAL